MSTIRLSDIHDTLAIKRSMDVRRDEYLNHMTFRANMRPLFTEIFGPLVGLKEEWRAQGASEAEIDMSAFRYRRPLYSNLPLNTGWLAGPRNTERILEETAEHIIARDTYGRTVKLIKGSATLALPLDHPVQTMDDWLRIKSHYQFSEERFSDGWEAAAHQAQAEGYVICASIPGGFDEPRQLMGEEALCIAFYEQPELIRDMLDTMADTAFRVLDFASRHILIDQLDVHEDFAGKSGPLIGPRHIREFLRPYYRRVWDMLSERGARLFSIDTDGNVMSVLDTLIDAGINTMLPMEPDTGMDIIQIRAKYGDRLAFVGGIDKHVIRRALAEIDAELEYKLPPMARSGGCLLGLDHRIPNGTPIAHYRHYIAKVWEIFEREA